MRTIAWCQFVGVLVATLAVVVFFIVIGITAVSANGHGPIAQAEANVADARAAVAEAESVVDSRQTAFEEAEAARAATNPYNSPDSYDAALARARAAHAALEEAWTRLSFARSNLADALQQLEQAQSEHYLRFITVDFPRDEGVDWIRLNWRPLPDAVSYQVCITQSTGSIRDRPTTTCAESHTPEDGVYGALFERKSGRVEYWLEFWVVRTDRTLEKLVDDVRAFPAHE